MSFLADQTPACVIFDVEPLVSFWNHGPADLESGVARVLDEVAALPSVRMVAFATNSERRPAAALTREGLDIRYVAYAGKPFRSKGYRDLPKPGIVVGDQVATDGLLAWRLGYTFLRYRPAPSTIPAGPRVMGYVGRPFERLLFTAQGVSGGLPPA